MKKAAGVSGTRKFGLIFSREMFVMRLIFEKLRLNLI